ncbi:hypothetical protein QFC20_003749 [Naganishia adeliensis]|uniref:Uncharacterized protein n=1 Tax=Naganishia adeliensis TaxID=92952 RepID=A0ACC2W637_9TREE|nr:hypothetical protein QFC20_003749 [Naganishia adeliensis]
MPNPSIVDKLVRAAAAVPSDIPDDELNRHVADILAKEAKEKESKWREMGIGVYLEDKPGSSSRAPKPNTRFLKSLVRDVDGHNTSLLREQANAARAAAADKFYQDSRSQPGNGAASKRDVDPDVARMKRLFGGVVGNAASSRSNETSAQRSSSSRHQAPSRPESRQHHSSSSTKYGGAAGSWRRESANHSGSRFDYEDEASEDEDKGWSRKDVGRSQPRSAMQRAEEEEAKQRRRKHSPEPRKVESRAKEREASRSPKSSSRRREFVPEPTRQIPPDHYPSAGPAIPSKMDRYFEPTYDPKKDYRAMLDAQDVAVPRTGLVPNVDIGWDSMLSTIKYRGQEKNRTTDRDREKERAQERDREERERAKERRSRSSREKERSSGRDSKSRSKTRWQA